MQSFSKLDLTVKEFLEEIPPNPVFGLNPIFARPSDDLGMVTPFCSSFIGDN